MTTRPIAAARGSGEARAGRGQSGFCAAGAMIALLCVPLALAQTPSREPPAAEAGASPNTPASPADAAAPAGPAGVSPPPAESSAPAAGGDGANAKPAASDTGPLAPLAWLEGCWQGAVNQREFREHWLPLRGGIMIGAGQSVLRGKMQDYEFMRLEPKPDGVVFTQFSGDRSESSFRLDSTVNDDKDIVFTFANTADAFPARLVYRRGTGGWLYETIEGKLDGNDRKVIYPLRRVDCETGELIHQ